MTVPAWWTDPTFVSDAVTLGLVVGHGTISDDKTGQTGGLSGARARVDRSVRKPTIWAQLTTKFSERGQMVGKAVLFVTVECPGGVTLIREVNIKHELVARRLAAGVNALSNR